MAQTVKNLPAVQETGVQSLGWEDALEKGMSTHSGIIAWRIPWTEEPVFVAAWGLSLIVASRGYSLVAMCRLLIIVASLVAEHRL